MGLNLCVLSEIYESEMWDSQVHIDGSLKYGEGHSITDTSRTDKHDWSSRSVTIRHDPSRTITSLATRYGSGILDNPPKVLYYSLPLSSLCLLESSLHIL